MCHMWLDLQKSHIMYIRLYYSPLCYDWSGFLAHNKDGDPLGTNVSAVFNGIPHFMIITENYHHEAGLPYPRSFMDILNSTAG